MNEKTATITVKGEPGELNGCGLCTILSICPKTDMPCPGFLVRNPDGSGCPAREGVVLPNIKDLSDTIDFGED